VPVATVYCFSAGFTTFFTVVFFSTGRFFVCPVPAVAPKATASESTAVENSNFLIFIIVPFLPLDRLMDRRIFGRAFRRKQPLRQLHQ
jgi:hypothetical protein